MPFGRQCSHFKERVTEQIACSWQILADPKISRRVREPGSLCHFYHVLGWLAADALPRYTVPMAPLDQYVQQLLTERGMSHPDPAVRAEMVEELTERVDDFVNRRIIDAMSERDAARFVDLLERGNPTPQSVQSFVAQHVPNREQVARDALQDFRKQYLGR
jgi:hypothetical protein